MVITTMRTERFDTSDPSIWFLQFEAGLRINQIPDHLHYDHLLSQLHKEARQPVTAVIQDPPEQDKYQSLKKALIEAHSSTNRDKLRKLLQGERIGDRKPSTFLGHLRDLAPEKMEETVLKEFWWKELPEPMRAILSSIPDANLTALAAAADSIHQELGAGSINAYKATSPDRQNNYNLLTLIEKVAKLQAAVEELQRQNRSRGQFRTYDRYRPRSRTPRPAYRNETHDAEGRCRNHVKYGEATKKCIPPCTYQKN